METSNGHSAEHVPSQGVLQGSVLSPFLFNCVMVNLPHRFPPGLQHSIYADDVCIWASGPNALVLQSTLQEGLTSVRNFLKECGMTLCYAKTAVLPFTRKLLKAFILSLQGQPIQTVKEHRFPGVT